MACVVTNVCHYSVFGPIFAYRTVQCHLRVTPFLAHSRRFTVFGWRAVFQRLDGYFVSWWYVSPYQYLWFILISRILGTIYFVAVTCEYLWPWHKEYDTDLSTKFALLFVFCKYQRPWAQALELLLTLPYVAFGLSHPKPSMDLLDSKFYTVRIHVRILISWW